MTAHPLFDIGGRTAPVTGSSRGIGPAPARGLAESGCTVVLDGRDAARLAEAAAGPPGDVRTAVFDVTDGPSVAAGVADVEERVGPLDILVDNAGMQLRAPLPEFTDSGWHRILDSNSARTDAGTCAGTPATSAARPDPRMYQGGFAARVTVPADRLRAVPAGLGLRRAALTEPPAVAMHAVPRAGPVAGRRVLAADRSRSCKVLPDLGP
ncbi:hypothetical protein GCM10022206_10730 [Streptomyces chiangmaiensis]